MAKPSTTKRRMLLDPTPVDETTLELARQRTATVFHRYDHIAVMFSGGKDSTIILHLAMEEHAKRKLKKPLDVIFFDEEAIPYETEEYVRKLVDYPQLDIRWYCLPIHRGNSSDPEAPDWYPWAPEVEDLWCRPFPPEGIDYTQFEAWDLGPVSNRIPMHEMNSLLFDPRKHGRVGLLMGIRAQESMTRRRSVLRRKEDNWIVTYTRDTFKVCRWPGCTEPTVRPTASTCEEHRGRRLMGTDMADIPNVDKCYPIYDWLTEDVWTYHRDFVEAEGHPVNHYYDLLEMAGVPHSKQRCAPPYGTENIAGLWTFKTCCPELWDKMVERVPGAATAARYARTRLYGFGERPVVDEADWWDERAWKALIVQLLKRHSDRIARLTAEQLEVFISRHYAKTKDPILPDIPHPVTGLSWAWLAMVAQRADAFHRKKPEWQVAQRGSIEALYKHRERYIEGLKRWRLEQRARDIETEEAVV